MHLFPTRMFFLGPNSDKGGSLVGVLVASALFILVSLGIFSGMKQQNQISAKLREKVKFVQIENELKSRIHQTLKNTIATKGCNAKFTDWNTESKKLKPYSSVDLSFARKAISALPQSVRNRCKRQYKNWPLDKGVYFCAEVLNKVASKGFLDSYRAYAEIKILFLDTASGKKSSCKWDSNSNQLKKQHIKYLLSIYWKRKSSHAAARSPLNFYRSWNIMTI